MTDSPPIPDTGGNLTWACVDDGFYVASDRNGFVGYIDRVEDDSFQVCNASSQQLGIFSRTDFGDGLLGHGVSNPP